VATWSVQLSSQSELDLSTLPTDHREGLLNSCLFLQSGDVNTYWSCLNRELLLYRRAAPSPDLSTLPTNHREAILYACRLRQGGNPAAYWNCLNREFSIYQRVSLPQELQNIPENDRYAILFSCEITQTGPLLEYWNCLKQTFAAYQRENQNSELFTINPNNENQPLPKRATEENLSRSIEPLALKQSKPKNETTPQTETNYTLILFFILCLLLLVLGIYWNSKTKQQKRSG
jgi:hypothetical protein